MAFAAKSTGTPNWAHGQHQLPGEYAMMESLAMPSYDSLANTAGPLQRPLIRPYMIQGSYSPGLANSLIEPHYQVSNHYQCGGYQSPMPPHTSTAIIMEFDDGRSMGHENSHSQVSSYRRQTIYAHADQAPPPARANPQASTVRSTSLNPTLGTKSITSNETINPGKHISFETEVDKLMRTIQQQADLQVDTGQRPPTVSDANLESQATPTSMVTKRPRRIYYCDSPCKKSFTQKAQLDIHRRAHTGDKPYVCNYPGCDLGFSQLGNLKTHRRRHTGERPFACDKCDRQFAQRGNLRAHLQTHQGLKPFLCLLDNCKTRFSSLGNMKTHQNNFHKETLGKLTTKFAQVLSSGQEIPEADRELFKYFATHYKNSNKGIKGRGKARTVAERKTNESRSPRPNSYADTLQYPTPQIASAQQTSSPIMAHGLPIAGNLSSYSVSCCEPNATNAWGLSTHPATQQWPGI